MPEVEILERPYFTEDYRSIRYRARLSADGLTPRTMAVVMQAAKRGVWQAPVLETPFEASHTAEEVAALLAATSRGAATWNEWNADTGKPVADAA